MHNAKARRPIRSFVRREGRLTPGQERALTALGPRLLLDAQGDTLDLTEVFGRTAPVTLEIGFGNGESLATQAQAHPERDFIGIEVHRPGVGHLLQTIARLALDNLRVFEADAVEVLERRIDDGSLAVIQIFFPDPWHKKRHHKRRLIQPAFVSLLARKLAPGGRIHLATDWAEYAEHMLDVMEATPELGNLHGSRAFAPQPTGRPATKFEQRGQRLGHGVWDLIYRRI
ncbi:tRNA (guanosine(46)-N7)-methyltransferase TrmB [Acidihalobacter ferrooxydans]|uniref:tRNA (guanine-N(7)-)-methyltransferase n=1 Tax=Acidihalobacter ferrooxydans TaxID=1765967 RepID=A0A1P8UDJ4_9GAMM|nr:tRNA (guanosine(46)-N7)-methyltransferase TrmB [Acidihalobacter ferrooxydans]APZ41915.1 tRNA (guanosine(46)-N7)-methyltransferase TrmB [Acidihalobacter ferrooxydans]